MAVTEEEIGGWQFSHRNCFEQNEQSVINFVAVPFFSVSIKEAELY